MNSRTPQAVTPPATRADLAALQALAALTACLSSAPEQIEQTIDGALDQLRDATGAEAAELLLAEPAGGDLLLSAFRGPFQDAFVEITRFRPGEDLPGLVLASARPVISQDLAHDSRYQRARVIARGFRAYAGVPLLGDGCSGGAVGVLGLTTRRADVDLARAQRLLEGAAVPLSLALRAALGHFRELGVQAALVAVAAAAQPDDALRALLTNMVAATRADGGALRWPPATGADRQVTSGDWVPATCPAQSLAGDQGCPALNGGHSVALWGSRDHWLAPCRTAPLRGAVTCCLPLVAAQRAVGLLQLQYAQVDASPPTHHLPKLLALAGGVAPLLEARYHVRDGRPVSSELSAHVAPPPAPITSPASTVVGQWGNEDGTGDTADGTVVLDVRCLGTFTLSRNRTLLPPEGFARRKALTLLKILFVHAGQRLPADTLVEFLWPEIAPDQGLNRLYGVVHTLRMALEPTSPAGSGAVRSGHKWLFILGDNGRYGLNPSAPYRLDTSEFLTHVQHGRAAEARGDSTVARRSYAAAAELYRGDLLQDEPSAEWCWLEREHLREMCLNVLQRSAALWQLAGAAERSVTCYRQALSIDPWREELHQGLLRTLADTGRRDEALRQYHVLCEMLRRELGIAPSAQTEALVQQIRLHATHPAAAAG